MAVQQTSRVFSISLPPDLADKAEATAERQSRSVSEVLGDALRAYEIRQEAVRQMFEYADSRPHSYTEEDIPRLIREVRDEARKEAAERSH